MPDYKIRLIVTGEDRGASRVMGNVAGSLGRIGEFAAGGVIASGIEQVIGGTARAGRAAVGSLGQMITGAGEFEQRVDTINSLLNGTEADAEKIGQLIYDLGLDPNLQVNANQAADTVETLARNGLELEQVMDGAARSTVLLANATGAEFGDAADIATDAMSIFGLEADQMGEAVDGITGVVTNSKFSINDYQLALAQGGAAAALAGMSFDEFNTGVAAISSNFASGSDAGTSFKTMTQRLVPSTDAASAAMDYLGLSFTNADGSMKSAAEVAGELNRVFEGQIDLYSEVGGRTAEQNGELKRLTGMYTRTQNSIKDYEAGIKGANLSDEKRAEKLAELNGQLESIHGQMEPLLAIQGETVKTTRALTEAEKVHYMQTIFGTDAMRAAAAMAGYTEEEFNALMDTIGESDAEVAAARRMDNLAGDMEVFGGIVETLKLQIGSEFQPAARSFVQSVSSIAEAVGPRLVGLAGAAAEWVEPWVTSLEDAADRAVAAFDGAGGNLPGVAAAAGAALGYEVEVEATANVIDVAWGNFSYTYDSAAEVLDVSWGDFGVTYDAKAGVTEVDFDYAGFDVSYTYDAQAGIVDVDWNAGDKWGFTYDAEAQVVNVTTGPDLGNLDLTYEAEVGITNVDWGNFSYTYDAESAVRGVDWGKFSFSYDAESEVTEVGWGDFRYTYNALAGVESVDWGQFANTYESLAAVVGVGWGQFFNTYDSDAEVGSVDFGNWTHTYNVTAKVSTVIDDAMGSSGGGGNAGGFNDGGGASGSGGGGSSGFGSRAIGERNWGGGLVQVHRDEILAIPSGAHIFTPTEARQMAAGGAGGPNITINATVANDMDLNEMAYRLLDIIQRRN